MVHLHRDTIVKYFRCTSLRRECLHTKNVLYFCMLTASSTFKITCDDCPTSPSNQIGLKSVFLNPECIWMTCWSLLETLFYKTFSQFCTIKGYSYFGCLFVDCLLVTSTPSQHWIFFIYLFISLIRMHIVRH